MSIEAQLAAAWRMAQQGELDAARRLCSQIVGANPLHAAAIHLSGLLEKRAGNTRLAEVCMRRSIELQPQNPEFHANLGNLLSDRAAWNEAVTAYRAALVLAPRVAGVRLALIDALRRGGLWAEAEQEARRWIADDGGNRARVALGDVLRVAQRFPEAEAAYRDVIAQAPQEGRAHHNLGAMLSSLHRSEESLTELEAAAAVGISGPQFAHNLGQTLLQLGRLEAAEAAFERALQSDPYNTDSHTMLARVRYVLGRTDFAEHIRLAADAANSSPLRILYATLQWRAGHFALAEQMLRAVLETDSENAEVSATLAYVLLDTGRYAEAVDVARRAYRPNASNNLVCDALVSAWLSCGESQSADEIIQERRLHSPLDQRWLAHAAIASRLTDGRLCRQLYDYSRFVRSYEPETPRGWSSRAEFLRDLAQVLERRHVGQESPLDQSLRSGTQTTRSLLTDPDPVLQAFIASLDAPLREYCALLGDAEHPFTERNSGALRLTGCWSVRLRGGGFHVNHVHPQGWISSAYYVSLPQHVAADGERAAWIQFGEPRFPVPGAGAEHFVEPVEGKLVLFPSYMWHGTVPFNGSESRLTIAFDALPV